MIAVVEALCLTFVQAMNEVRSWLYPFSHMLIPSVPEIADVEVPIGIRAALSVIAGLGIVASVVAFSMMLARRHSAVVVSASPLFVYIILVCT